MKPCAPSCPANRILPDSAYKSIKAAARRLIRDAGGQESAASISRGTHPVYSRYGNPNEEAHAPVDVIADLERDTGSPVVTRVLAGLAGFVLIPKPPAGGDPVTVQHLADLARETGEAVGAVGTALADDGAITPGEAARLGLRRELREAMEALARIDAALAAMEAGRDA